ncbi:hypothetical protein NDU88_004040 [Pleurodeles waltl]|uniref:Uncharacterized protein n=1 Tax=Pleurodeles waltl TaxID=8319 RepID=A0AAV7LH72_PLEWA|nr:hypothetical protein NDU88_004040 [Pleurodeles waltl]
MEDGGHHPVALLHQSPFLNLGATPTRGEHRLRLGTLDPRKRQAKPKRLKNASLTTDDELDPGVSTPKTAVRPVA